MTQILALERTNDFLVLEVLRPKLTINKTKKGAQTTLSLQKRSIMETAVTPWMLAYNSNVPFFFF